MNVLENTQSHRIDSDMDKIMIFQHIPAMPSVLENHSLQAHDEFAKVVKEFAFCRGLVKIYPAISLVGQYSTESSFLLMQLVIK